MYKLCLTAALVSFAACSTPQYAERMPIRPAPSMPLSPTPRFVAPSLMTPATQEPSVPPSAARPTTPPPSDDSATRAWLDQEIERNRYVPPPPPPVEVVERVVERPVYVQGPVVYERSPRYEYDYGYRPYYYEPYYNRGYYRHGTTFPLNTAVGAGLGAIIGNQSGHRGRGAWIGGGLGLLVDLSSRW